RRSITPTLFPYTTLFRSPITPDSHRTVVDIVSTINNVDRSVHFNAGNFRSAKFHHVIDMVDVIIFDDRENATHAADDSTLFTVMDVATANDVASDMLFQPSVVLAAA